MYDKDEESLINLILSKRKDLSRQDIENVIIEKMRVKNVSRKTALYLLSIDLGIRLESPVENYIKISQLTDGLLNVRVRGRILWLKDTEKLKQREGIYTRGALIDDTGIANIIFWDRSKEELEREGVTEDTLVEIINGYAKRSLSGKCEIHLTRRGNIKIISEEEVNIPYTREILKPVHEVNIGDDYVSVYGIVLSVNKEREVNVRENKVMVNSFMIGSEDKSIRVVLWRDSVQEYEWIKPGDKVVIYNGRVKLNKFNEIEIHVSRSSHIKLHPGLSINMKTTILRLSEIQPGYNLNKVYVRVLAKGFRRINEKDGRESLTFYVIDDTGDASLTIVGENVKLENIIRVQDIISIEKFRASLKGGVMYIFVDDSTKIEINPHDIPTILPVYSIPFKTARKISTMDKVINVEGKIIEFLEENIGLNIPFSTSSFLIEDPEGNPIKVVYRGKLENYVKEEIEEGDRVRVLAALLDMSSLLNTTGIPNIKLRAFSRIEKIG